MIAAIARPRSWRAELAAWVAHSTGSSYFAERDLRNVWRRLLRLHPRRSDDLGPLLGFVGNQLCEFRGEATEGGGTECRKACLHLGIGKGRINLPIELLDDFFGRVPRRAEPSPRA